MGLKVLAEEYIGRDGMHIVSMEKSKSLTTKDDIDEIVKRCVIGTDFLF